MNSDQKSDSLPRADCDIRIDFREYIPARRHEGDTFLRYLHGRVIRR